MVSPITKLRLFHPNFLRRSIFHYELKNQQILQTRYGLCVDVYFKFINTIMETLFLEYSIYSQTCHN